MRRLWIEITGSIRAVLQWTVFEPSAPALWDRVRREVEDYLTKLWRQGVLHGATAEEAFFVECDRSTMSDDDIRNGRLIANVGFALAGDLRRSLQVVVQGAP